MGDANAFIAPTTVRLVDAEGTILATASSRYWLRDPQGRPLVNRRVVLFRVARPGKLAAVCVDGGAAEVAAWRLGADVTDSHVVRFARGTITIVYQEAACA